MRNAARDYLRREGGYADNVDPQLVEGLLTEDAASSVQEEELWKEAWIEDRLRKAWEDLDRYQKRHQHARNQHHDSTNVFFTVLDLWMKHPKAGSRDLAQRLSTKVGRSCSQDNWRQQLHRAIEEFTTLVRNGLQETPPGCTGAEQEHEFDELGLKRAIAKFLREKRKTGDW